MIATHADQALCACWPTRAPRKRRLLGAFGYSRNLAVLHADPALMPRRRRAWASWNYTSRQRGASKHLSVTYWMNRLQDLPDTTPLFVTLNPDQRAARRSW